MLQGGLCLGEVSEGVEGGLNLSNCSGILL